jgi:hypothetical protein
MGPEIVRGLSLSNTVDGQLCVLPRCGCISIQLSPVTVPRRSTIEGFGGVVPTFTMAREEEKFIVNIEATFVIQARNLTRESLPLRQTAGL